MSQSHYNDQRILASPEEYIEKYADCFFYGYGVRQSKKKALEMYQYISFKDDFETITQSDLQLRVLKKKMELEDNHSLSLFGDYYYSNGEYLKAISMYEKAIDEDDANACLGLANCYLNGYGVHFDYIKAYNLLTKAYALKNQKAAKYLAECYRFGIGTAKDKTKEKYFEDISQQPEDGIWSMSYLD